MPDIKAVARKLAESHRKADRDTRTVKYFPGAEADHVCLLEVSDAAPTTGEVLPFFFTADPDHGVDYGSVVILLSPTEWQDVQDGKLPLPDGWDLSKAEDL